MRQAGWRKPPSQAPAGLPTRPGAAPCPWTTSTPCSSARDWCPPRAVSRAAGVASRACARACGPARCQPPRLSGMCVGRPAEGLARAFIPQSRPLPSTHTPPKPCTHAQRTVHAGPGHASQGRGEPGERSLQDRRHCARLDHHSHAGQDLGRARAAARRRQLTTHSSMKSNPAVKHT